MKKPNRCWGKKQRSRFGTATGTGLPDHPIVLWQTDRRTMS